MFRPLAFVSLMLGTLHAANPVSQDPVNQNPVYQDPVSQDKEYIQGKRLYGIGIKQDPVLGTKDAKGRQDLTSPLWLKALSSFIATDTARLRELLRQAKDSPAPFLYLMNHANACLLTALEQGLHSEASLKQFTESAWAAMAALQIDEFPYARYSKAQRKQMSESFFDAYLNDAFEGQTPHGLVIRMDLVPSLALERLCLHLELCTWKFDKPRQWEHEGFPIGYRMASLKRHLDAVFAKQQDEDHIAHLLWNYMAIYQVCRTHPELNDLPDYHALAQR